MPIYEYACVKCNHVFSALQKLGASEKDTTCPGCGSREVKKKMSSFCCSPGSNPVPSSSSARFSGGGG